MRETKYRAWFHGEMLSHEDLIDKDQNNYAMYTILTDGEQEDGIVFMQYTGIKDKNGREIYEGDVIRYTKIFYTDCSREEIEEVSEPVIGSFYYAEDLYPGIQFEDGAGSLFWPGTIDSDEFEIIGNIYENPELI